MNITIDHKIQIFCAALSSVIQAQGTVAAAAAEGGKVLWEIDFVEQATELTNKAVKSLGGGQQ